MKKESNDITQQKTEITNNQSKRKLDRAYFANAFDLAKALIAELPLVPTNDRVYELVQDIERGDFEDISSIEEAREHWPEWVERTKDILKGRRILVSRLKKLK